MDLDGVVATVHDFQSVRNLLYLWHLYWTLEVHLWNSDFWIVCNYGSMTLFPETSRRMWLTPSGRERGISGTAIIIESSLGSRNQARWSLLSPRDELKAVCWDTWGWGIWTPFWQVHNRPCPCTLTDFRARLWNQLWNAYSLHRPREGFRLGASWITLDTSRHKGIPTKLARLMASLYTDTDSAMNCRKSHI